MANARGNEYSRNHTTLDPNKNNKYWDFSWHEIAIYDVPASIDYILNITNRQNLYYVGYSQGATTLYALLSMMPVYNTKIKAYTHMGPAVFMNHCRSPFFRVLQPFLPLLEVSLNTFFNLKSLLMSPFQQNTQICYFLVGKCF